ncbi:YqjF family protein [Halobaculum rarum]|uniref:YqjF family protein n=1 Tax=Halobaculum rarum TaxID=3075122 RepID=UPI0032AE96DB
MQRRLLSMRWRDALFAHWRVDPATVEARLPESLSVATYEGDAYLGVVPFEMTDIRPRGVPVGLSFPELNLRTYVTDGDTKGVYFFNLDAADPIGVAVARTLFRLPYYRAAMDVTRDDDRVTVTSHRTHPGAPEARFDATYGPDGETRTPEPGSLEAFLVENYRFYTEGRGRVYYGDIAHEPWPLTDADAEIRTNTLFEANGFEAPAGEPICHYSPGTEVTADRIRRLDTTATDTPDDDRPGVEIPVERDGD